MKSIYGTACVITLSNPLGMVTNCIASWGVHFTLPRKLSDLPSIIDFLSIKGFFSDNLHLLELFHEIPNMTKRYT